MKGKQTSETWDQFIKYRVDNEGPFDMKGLSAGILGAIGLGMAWNYFYNSAAELIRLVFL